MSGESDPRPRVVYIAGVGRSGSTLLANLLGQLPGVCNVGEASRYLSNSRMIARDVPCGCGEVLDRCEFWSSLADRPDEGARAFGTRYLRLRFLPLLMAPDRFPGFRRRLAGYQAAMTGLYEGLVEKTGCPTIVDSSKNPTNAMAMSRTDTIDLRVIHLVRDPRGVVSDWIRPKQYLSGRSAGRVVAWWLGFNLAAELLRARAAAYLLVRYEDFLRDPAGVFEAVARDGCDERGELTVFRPDGRVRLTAQHDVAGNPDKFDRAPVAIEARPWVLSTALRLPVSAVTYPLRRRYARRPATVAPSSMEAQEA